MSKKRKILTGFGIFIAILAVFYIESSIYPLSSQKPNYADVERVFNRMQFPADWQETRSSENRGIAGRRCPMFPESRCFHKSKSYNLVATTTINKVKDVMLQTGCPVVADTDNTSKGAEKKKYRLRCSVDGLNIGADYIEGQYFSVTVST